MKYQIGQLYKYTSRCKTDYAIYTILEHNKTRCEIKVIKTNTDDLKHSYFFKGSIFDDRSVLYIDLDKELDNV